jgi:AraC-like DNA-binding protein
MGMFYIAGIGLAVFIEFLLVSKKDKSTPDMVLTVWMFFILVHLFLLYLYFTGDAYNLPFLLGTELPLPLLQGVFLFIYTCHLTNQLPERLYQRLLHFLPAGLMYVYLITFFVLPADQKVEVYRHQGAGYGVFNTIRHVVISISGVFYVAWTAVLLRKHRHTIRDRFSDLHRVNLLWLQILTVGMGGVWFLALFFHSEPLTMAGMVIFIFLIGFFGVRQGTIFAQTTADESEQKRKYPKSGLTEDAARTLHESLIRLMIEEAAYKKSDLSITDVAAKLGVHPNYLSQVINQRENKNFYDFVNTYRIEEFKRLLEQQKHQQFTLLSLAYDCGFNSKSSFNRYFKKATGKTPSEYTATAS